MYFSSITCFQLASPHSNSQHLSELFFFKWWLVLPPQILGPPQFCLLGMNPFTQKWLSFSHLLSKRVSPVLFILMMLLFLHTFQIIWVFLVSWCRFVAVLNVFHPPPCCVSKFLVRVVPSRKCPNPCGWLRFWESGVYHGEDMLSIPNIILPVVN